MKKDFITNPELSARVDKTVRAHFGKIKGNSADQIAQEVVEGLSRGDQEAFRTAYLHSYDKLMKFLTILLHREEDAEEVVQDIFLSILEHPQRINPKMNFKGYLFTIARTKAFDLIARRKLDEKYYSHRQAQPADYDLPPDETVMSNELSLIITAYIENMPPQRRRVFEMNRIEGKTVSEIADTLKLKPQTIRNYLNAADDNLERLISLFIILFIST